MSACATRRCFFAIFANQVLAFSESRRSHSLKLGFQPHFKLSLHITATRGQRFLGCYSGKCERAQVGSLHVSWPGRLDIWRRALDPYSALHPPEASATLTPTEVFSLSSLVRPPHPVLLAPFPSLLSNVYLSASALPLPWASIISSHR